MVDLTGIYKRLGIEIDPPEIEEIQDIYINKLIDALAIGRVIKYRYDEEFEKPYCFAQDSCEAIGKTKSEALINLIECLFDNNKLNNIQKETIFYIISYLG